MSAALSIRNGEVPEIPAEIRAQVLIYKNTSQLTAEQKLSFLSSLCQSLGLNPLTNPFEFITLNGKETLYARKDCTDQLRKIYGVSVSSLETKTTDGVYVVTAHVKMENGRTDSAIGALSIQGLRGESLANALMKCETKAKRRATLSICGLGILDETETETIPGSPTNPATKPAAQSRDVTPPAKASSPNDRFGVSKHEKLITAFSAIGISREEIVGKFKLKSIDDLTDVQVDELRWAYQKIKSGEVTRSELFPDNELDAFLKEPAPTFDGPPDSAHDAARNAK